MFERLINYIEKAHPNDTIIATGSSFKFKKEAEKELDCKFIWDDEIELRSFITKDTIILRLYNDPYGETKWEREFLNYDNIKFELDSGLNISLTF